MSSDVLAAVRAAGGSRAQSHGRPPASRAPQDPAQPAASSGPTLDPGAPTAMHRVGKKAGQAAPLARGIPLQPRQLREVTARNQTAVRLGGRRGKATAQTLERNALAVVCNHHRRGLDHQPELPGGPYRTLSGRRGAAARVKAASPITVPSPRPSGPSAGWCPEIADPTIGKAPVRGRPGPFHMPGRRWHRTKWVILCDALPGLRTG